MTIDYSEMSAVLFRRTLLERVPHLCNGNGIMILSNGHAFTIVGVVIPLQDGFTLDKLPPDMRTALEHSVANLATGISTMFYEITKGTKS